MCSSFNPSASSSFKVELKPRDKTNLIICLRVIMFVSCECILFCYKRVVSNGFIHNSIDEVNTDTIGSVNLSWLYALTLNSTHKHGKHSLNYCVSVMDSFKHICKDSTKRTLRDCSRKFSSKICSIFTQILANICPRKLPKITHNISLGIPQEISPEYPSEISLAFCNSFVNFSHDFDRDFS